MGHSLDKQEGNRITRFRDKSVLYGGRKEPDDEPLGVKEYKYKFLEDYTKKILQSGRLRLLKMSIFSSLNRFSILSGLLISQKWVK